MLSSAVERLVIFCPSSLSGCVIATPLLRAVRAALPDAWMLGVMKPGADELLHGLAIFNELIVDDLAGLFGPWRVAQKMKRFEPEAGLSLGLQEVPRARAAAMAMRLSRVPVRIGLRETHGSSFLTHRICSETASQITSQEDRYRVLAKFVIPDARLDPQPTLLVTENEELNAKHLVPEIEQPFLVLAPAGGRSYRQWPDDRYAAVANVLADRIGCRVLLAGAADDAASLRRIEAAAMTPPVNVLERQVSIGPLKHIFRCASLLITNDNALRHLAGALGTPTVALFGPSDPRRSAVYPTEHRLLAEPFLPDAFPADHYPRACRMERIPVNDVLFAAERLLSQTSMPRSRTVKSASKR